MRQATTDLSTSELQRRVLKKDGRVIIIPGSNLIKIPGPPLQ
jgi:hypothetical protein